MTHSNFTGPAKLDHSIERLASVSHPPKPIKCRPKKTSLNALLFVECSARHLSFTKAAEELGVSLFAVSAQVRNIEQRFGQPLFVRSWRALELTELGQVVLPLLQSGFGDIFCAVTMLQQAKIARPIDDNTKKRTQTSVAMG